ncbi:MAG: hypothetical protein RRY72_05630 [Bacteroides sp.]
MILSAEDDSTLGRGFAIYRQEIRHPSAEDCSSPGGRIFPWYGCPVSVQTSLVA